MGREWVWEWHFLFQGVANSAFGTNILDVTISYTLLIGAILFSSLIGMGAGILPLFRLQD